MNAKTSSVVEKNDSAWLTELVFSFTTVCPVTTSTPGYGDHPAGWNIELEAWSRVIPGRP